MPREDLRLIKRLSFFHFSRLLHACFTINLPDLVASSLIPRSFLNKFYFIFRIFFTLCKKIHDVIQKRSRKENCSAIFDDDDLFSFSPSIFHFNFLKNRKQVMCKLIIFHLYSDMSELSLRRGKKWQRANIQKQ